MGGTRVEPSSSWAEGTNVLWRVPQFRTNLANVHVFRVWEESRVEKTLHMHKENNMTWQSLNLKSNPELSFQLSSSLRCLAVSFDNC